MKKLIVFAGTMLCILLNVSMAQYVVGPSVVAGGGARMTGGSYVITGTTGQSAPVGVSSGGSYQTHHGFWHAVTGNGASLDPMILEIVLIDAATVRLSWGAIPAATHYDLYRNTTPHFIASGSPWRTVAAPSTLTETGSGVGDTNTNYFFLGKARNAGQTSPESNTVGEFDFGAAIPALGFTYSFDEKDINN